MQGYLHCEYESVIQGTPNGFLNIFSFLQHSPYTRSWKNLIKNIHLIADFDVLANLIRH